MPLGRKYLVLAALVLAGGCNSITDPSKNLNETFTGTIPLGGSSETHNFTASKRGEYSVTINTMTPPTGSLVGVQFGQQSTSGCLVITTNAGQIGKPALTGPIDAGNWCVTVYDVGTLAQSETYTLTISHP